MTVEFGSTLPEDLLIPDLNYPLEDVSNRVFDVIRDGRTVSIRKGNKEFRVGERNTDGDLYIFGGSNNTGVSFGQQQEYRFFLILLKYAHEVGNLAQILSVNGGNIQGLLEGYNGENVDTYFDGVNDLFVNINYPMNEEAKSPFFVEKGPHNSKINYYFHIDIVDQELVFICDGAEEFRVSKEEVVHYLRALILAAENGAGRTNPARYRELFRHVFSPEIRSDYDCSVEVKGHGDVMLVVNDFSLNLRENEEITYFFYFFRKVSESGVPINRIISRLRNQLAREQGGNAFKDIEIFISNSADLPDRITYSNLQGELEVEHKVDEAIDFMRAILDNAQGMRYNSITQGIQSIQEGEIDL